MKLHIDTRISDRSRNTLLEIKEDLKEKNLKISDVTSVEFSVGPGSFTGLRVGASIANALGYSLDIPVNGRDIKKAGVVEPEY